MFRDKTLIPTEAIRVLALGLLAERPRRYAELAQDLRRFIGLVLGPSLEMLAPSLELLRYEGLVEARGADAAATAATPGDSELLLTERGRSELLTLLRANVRAPVNDTNRLVIVLKFRFLGMLPPDEQAAQKALLADIYDAERGRLEALRAEGSGEAFASWIDHETDLLGRRIAWLSRRD